VGAMGAALFLGPDVLMALRIERPSVVRPVVEVDGDIDGFSREEGGDLATDGQGHRALGLSERKVAEEPSGGSIRASLSALGSRSVDGGAPGGRSEEEIAGVSEGGGAEGAGEGALQERKEPGEGDGTHPTVGQPSGRWVFLTEAGSWGCGLTTAAAAVWRHTGLSAVSLSSTGNSIGNRSAPEAPRTQRITSGGALPSTGVETGGSRVISGVDTWGVGWRSENMEAGESRPSR
jgi:hypothetical protein